MLLLSWLTLLKNMLLGTCEFFFFSFFFFLGGGRFGWGVVECRLIFTYIFFQAFPTEKIVSSFSCRPPLPPLFTPLLSEFFFFFFKKNGKIWHCTPLSPPKIVNSVRSPYEEIEPKRGKKKKTSEIKLSVSRAFMPANGFSFLDRGGGKKHSPAL